MIIDKRIMENEINKWIKVQEHPVLEFGVTTKENGYVNVGQYLDSNRGNSIETMGRNFVEYLNQPETIKRLNRLTMN